MTRKSTPAKLSPAHRSRVTNKRGLYVGPSDGRTAEARRFRDLYREVMSDLGGAEHLSEGQRQIARRCALMATQCEMLESKAAEGEAIDLEVFGKLSDRIGRGFARLGLRRVARDVTPASALADHFAQPFRPAAE